MKFVYKLDISNHKTILNEKFLITFPTSFKSLLNLNQNFQHKLSCNTIQKQKNLTSPSTEL